MCGWEAGSGQMSSEVKLLHVSQYRKSINLLCKATPVVSLLTCATHKLLIPFFRASNLYKDIEIRASAS